MGTSDPIRIGIFFYSDQEFPCIRPDRTRFLWSDQNSNRTRRGGVVRSDGPCIHSIPLGCLWRNRVTYFNKWSSGYPNILTPYWSLNSCRTTLSHQPWLRTLIHRLLSCLWGVLSELVTTARRSAAVTHLPISARLSTAVSLPAALSERLKL